MLIYEFQLVIHCIDTLLSGLWSVVNKIQQHEYTM